MATVGPGTCDDRTGGDRQRGPGRCAIALLAALAAGPVASVARAEGHQRFLVVYEHHSTLVANIEIAAGIAAVLTETPAAGREVYSEYMDLERFPGVAHVERFAEAMADKYGALPIDAVLAAGPRALAFVLEHRQGFAPGAPVVFGAVTSQTTGALELPPDVRGVVSGFDLRGTMDLALRLQPEAERVVVMTGVAPFDRSWEARARKELLGQVAGREIAFVSDLTLAGFEAMAGALGRDTILLILSVFEDAEGRRFIPRETAAAIAAAATAPAYGVYSTYMGAGLLGGHVESFVSIGETMAELAQQAADGAANGPAIVETVRRPVVDWRQLRRFGIDASLLPPGTERLFYAPTAWERYRREVLLAAAIILAQSATIAALVIQERRRRRIAGELAAERLELAHLSRTSQLGALSGALAHELNQPLTSILANAEAGARLLDRAPPDLEELAAILADIAADDRRAAGIITQLRRLMVKGDSALEDVDLSQVVAATVALARSELIARQTRVEIRRGQPELPVRGNLAQLQQVLLNLILNAAEAMAELPPAERRIVVETRAREDGVRELAVIDRGPGLSAEMQAEVFKPFVSSKAGGLGFGLSICRSIARAHGGALAFDAQASRGARIVLTLPPP